MQLFKEVASIGAITIAKQEFYYSLFPSQLAVVV